MRDPAQPADGPSRRDVATLFATRGLRLFAYGALEIGYVPAPWRALANLKPPEERTG